MLIDLLTKILLEVTEVIKFFGSNGIVVDSEKGPVHVRSGVNSQEKLTILEGCSAAALTAKNVYVFSDTVSKHNVEWLTVL